MGNLGKKISVLVVDDHPIVHEGLEHLLNREDDIEVCGYSETVNGAIENIEKLKPDFAIVDLSLKGGVSGLELVKAIRDRYPDIKTLVLSMHDENLYAERSIRAGANGYLMKEELRGTIVKAIRHIMKGKLFLSEKIVTKFLDDLMFDQQETEERDIDKLSNRELEVFRLIGRGYKTNEIAKMLNVSAKTINTHRYRLQEKLNLRDSASLVKYAIEFSYHNK